MELQNSGGQSFGDIDMTTALTNSVNTYWAQVGEQLGTDTMVTYMERFGFYSDPSSTTRPTRWRPAASTTRTATSCARASTSAAWPSDKAAPRASCWLRRRRWRRSLPRSAMAAC